MLNHWVKPAKFPDLDDKNFIGQRVHKFAEDSDLSTFEIAILGYEENASMALRKAYYSSYKSENEVKTVDLGNLSSPNPAALLSIYEELQSINMTLIVLALPDTEVVNIVNSLNNSFNDKRNIIIHNGLHLDVYAESPATISFCGVQSHNLSLESRSLLNSKYSGSINLGDLKNNISLSEPLMRQNDHVFLSTSAIKYSDAPCQNGKNTSGIMSEELCQLMHYAGFNMKCNLLIMCGLNDIEHDELSQDTLAQALWYFSNAHSSRSRGMDRSEDIIQYVVDLDELDSPLEFRHNTNTGEWWMYYVNELGHSQLLPSNQEDYEVAVKNQIPSRFFEMLK